jgi:WD40 repeat protein
VNLRVLDTAVRAIAFSPCGRFIICGGHDGTISRFSISSKASSEVIHSPDGAIPVRCLAFSPSGDWFASGHGDGILRVWDTTGTRPPRVIQAHSETVTSLDVSADGLLISSTGLDGTVRLWEVRTCEPLWEPDGHAGPVFAIALTRDGHWLLTGGEDRLLRIWNRRDGLLARRVSTPSSVRSLFLDEKGHGVFVAGLNGSLSRWALPEGTQKSSLVGHGDEIVSLAGSPDGTILVSLGRDERLAFWDSRSGALVRAIDDRSLSRFVCVCPHCGMLVCGSDQAKARQLAAGGEQFEDVTGSRAGASAGQFSPNGEMILFGYKDGRVQVLAHSGQRELFEDSPHREVVEAVAWSPNSNVFASAGAEGRVLLWDLVARRQIREWTTDSADVLCLSFDDTGHRLFAGLNNGEVREWCLKDCDCSPKKAPIKSAVETSLESDWRTLMECRAAEAYPALGRLRDRGPATSAFLRERIAIECSISGGKRRPDASFSRILRLLEELRSTEASEVLSWIEHHAPVIAQRVEARQALVRMRCGR